MTVSGDTRNTLWETRQYALINKTHIRTLIAWITKITTFAACVNVDIADW